MVSLILGILIISAICVFFEQSKIKLLLVYSNWNTKLLASEL